MDAFEILVVVLSVMLGIFLLVGIIVGVFVIAIMKQVKHISEKAAAVADNVEVASAFFKNTTATGAVVKILSNAADLFKKHKKEKD